jgi:CDP-diacylglycerol--glycerol-3-phosphate 3-phosphatidyltransferase
MTTVSSDVAGARPGGRPWFQRVLIRIVEVTHLTPNALTLIGFLGVVGSAALIVANWWWAAGFLYVAAALVDSLDGTLARYQGTSTQFGAFLDSTLDRVAEGVVFAALAIVFADAGEPWMVGVVVIALTASFAISYARARAESLGIDGSSGGLMGRSERLVFLGLAIFMGGLDMIPETVVIILAALAIYTTIERLVIVRRALDTTDTPRGASTS